MGEVVRLKPAITTTVTELTFERALRKIARQKAKIKALKAKQEKLIDIINGVHHEHICLLNEKMRADRVRELECRLCTPARADFLR